MILKVLWCKLRGHGPREANLGMSPIVVVDVVWCPKCGWAYRHEWDAISDSWVKLDRIPVVVRDEYDIAAHREVEEIAP